VANLVVRLLVTASSLSSNSDIPLKLQNGRHKQKSGQHALAHKIK
jgi:hypothetical protein